MMASWDACLLEQFAPLRWIECHSALGNYVQIAGVVAAIVGSAWLTKWSTERTLQPILDERRGRAKVIVYRLLPPIAEVKATIVRIRLAYEQTNGGMMLASENRLTEAIYYFRIDTTLPTDVLADLHVLDDAVSEEVAQLYFYLSQFNEFVDRNLPHLAEYDVATRERFAEHFETLLSAVEVLASNSWDILQRARGISPLGTQSNSSSPTTSSLPT